MKPINEKFNGLKVGDKVLSHVFLTAFSKPGVVLDLFEQDGFEYAIYEDVAGWRRMEHADKLTKVSGE